MHPATFPQRLGRVVIRLIGRTAIVAGAASGIGAAITTLFAHEGATVIAVDRPDSPIGTLYRDQTRIVALACDVTDDVAPAAAVERALQSGGGVDILVNNAGVSDFSPGDAVLDATWDRVFAVNTRAVFRFCRAAVPALKEQAAAAGRARIINVASALAERADFGQTAYSASKHAVAGLTKTLALELGRFGVTANYLMPGAILTGMTHHIFADGEVRGAWEMRTALRRLGTPEDMARAALLLASDEADFITGHGLVADGGLTLRL